MTDFLSRARTPTSPSPSPEPPAGATAQASSGLIQHESNVERGTALDATVNPIASSSSTFTAGQQNPSIILDPSSSERFQSSAIADNTLSSQNQSSEIARQVLEEKIRIGVDDLMQLAMCAGDVQPGDEDIVRMKINETMDSLQAIQDATNLADLTQSVPEDVMGMIDQGRNPDIHTRTFTNRLNGDNQQMRGQASNFDRYRSRLRAKIEVAFPEMKGELEAMDAV